MSQQCPYCKIKLTEICEGNFRCQKCFTMFITPKAKQAQDLRLIRPPIPPRKPKEYIPVKVRRFVFERDNNACQRCGSTEMLTIDHIYPESKGGKATIENCQVLCRSCNIRKWVS